MSFFLVLGCQRPDLEGTSTIRLTFPEDPQGSFTTQSAFPQDNKSCFAVTFSGPGIPSNAPECLPDLSLSSPFVAPNSELSLEVPKGENRTLKVWLFIRSSQNCAQVQWQNGLDTKHLFLVGQTNGIHLTQNVHDIYVEVAFPGVGQHFQAILPPRCRNPQVNIGRTHFRPGSHQLVGPQGEKASLRLAPRLRDFVRQSSR